MTKLHHSTKACWNRTASSRQNIYHNRPFCHRIRLPSVAYQSDNKTNKPARSIQKRAMRIIFYRMRHNDAIATARIPTLADRREALCRSLFATMQQTNHKLHHLLPPPRICIYSLRNTHAYGVPRCKTNRVMNSFVPYGRYNWQ